MDRTCVITRENSLARKEKIKNVKNSRLSTRVSHLDTCHGILGLSTKKILNKFWVLHLKNVWRWWCGKNPNVMYTCLFINISCSPFVSFVSYGSFINTLLAEQGFCTLFQVALSQNLICATCFCELWYTYWKSL